MKHYQKLIFLIISMTIVSLSVAGSSIYILYQISLQQQQQRLRDLVENQARLIEAMTGLGGEDNLVTNKSEIIKILSQSQNNLQGFVETGEFTLAEKVNNQIRFIISGRDDNSFQPKILDWNDPLAKLSRRALEGESGIGITTDYRGKKVLAAYEPIKSFNWALVAKIELAEIQRPYILAGLYTIIIAIILDVLGGYIIFKVYISIIDDLENSEKKYQSINQQLEQEIESKNLIQTALHQELELLDRIMELNQVGIVFANPESKIILANSQAEKLLGVSKEEISHIFYENNQGTITDYSGNLIRDEDLIFRRILTTKETVYDAHYAIKINHNTEILLSLNAAPILDQNQKLLGIVYSFEDVTKRVKFEKELYKSESLFRAIFEKSPVGIAIINLRGQILKTNSSLQKMLGYSEAELATTILLELFYPNDINQEIHNYHELLWGKQQIFQGEKRFLCHNQTTIWGNFIASLIKDNENQPQFILFSVEDISQRKQSEQDLKESEAKYRRMIETANEGIWIIDPEGKTTFANERMAKMLGYELSEMMELSLFDVAIPEDYNDVDLNLDRRRLGIAEKHDFKFVRKDGSMIWTLISTNPIFDTEGHYQGALGLITDITERKEIEEKLANANYKLKRWVGQLQQRNHEKILLSQMNDFLQACLTRQEAYHALGMLLEPLFPNYSGAVFMLHDSRNWVEVIANWGEKLHSHLLFSPQDCWAMRRGSVHYVNSSQTKLFCQHFQQDDDWGESLCIPMMALGKTTGLLYLKSGKNQKLTRSIQELGQIVAEKLSLTLANLQLRETLQSQSIRDPLTGLFNRRYLEEALEKEIYHAQKQENSLSVMMMDLDHFKGFNDDFGHDAGDLVLQETGKFLKNNIRDSDIVCRYGGEELTLILPGATLEDAQQKGEQIRQGIKNLKINYRDQLLRTVTVSIGIACFPNHGTTGEKVLKVADQALYQAKNQGRDRVIVAQDNLGND
jgi:diguanylate cyclase (GGDEF)-like protein/PAS domain S-box-containing protein